MLFLFWKSVKMYMNIFARSSDRDDSFTGIFFHLFDLTSMALWLCIVRNLLVVQIGRNTHHFCISNKLVSLISVK